MDYSQLSDFEINKRVAVALGHSIDGEKYGSASVGAFHSDGVVYKSHDYCNNPADAWPIIESNRIGVMPSEMKTKELWISTSGRGSYSYHENPLRAAMIVFLQMQDANNA